MFNATMQFNTAKWEEACRRQEAGKAIDKATTAWQVQYSSNLSLQRGDTVLMGPMRCVVACRCMGRCLVPCRSGSV
jgi:hypothetical protein